MTDTLVLKLSSNDRDLKQSNSSSDFVVNINQGKHLQQVKGVVVKQIACMNRMFNINQYNNKFRFWTGIPAGQTLDEKYDVSANDALGTRYDIVVPEGQYTFFELTLALTSQIVPTGLSLVITRDATNQKLTQMDTSAVRVSFYGSQLIRTGEPSGISELLGFESGEIYHVETGTPLLAPFIPKLEGVRFVSIHSRALSPINGLDASGISNNLLASFPMNTPYGTNEIYESPNPRSDLILYKTERNISQIDIRLRDEYGRPLDNRNGDITLVLNVIY